MALFMNSHKIDYDKTELNKHVSIIHCSNNLSLLQRKISNALLFHAYNFLLEREEHKISIRELCNYLNYRGNNQDAIKKAVKVLIATVIEWNLADDVNKEENWTASSILASVNIRGSICTYSYSSHMRKLLYNPTMYGKINLAIQSCFTSSYGLALYENCIRYKNLSQTKVFPIEVFRKLMGISSNKYLIFRDFKRRVIDKAVDEVNSLSDITIVPKMNKIGCKVIGISFGITERKKKRFNDYITSGISEVGENTNNRNSCDDLQKSSEALRKMIRTFGISKKEADNLIEVYGCDKIEDKIKQIELMPTFISGKINNLAGFLVAALKNNYLPTKSVQELTYDKAREKEKAEQIEKNKTKTSEKIKRDYDKYLDDQLSGIITNLDSSFLKKLTTHFENYLLETSNIFVLETFKKSEFSNKMVRVIFRIFLKNYYPDIINNLYSFEEFQKLNDKIMV